MSTQQRFRAMLEADGTDLNWVIARVTFLPEEVWEVRQGKRVKGTINGFAFRSSIFGSRVNGLRVLVTQSMQKGAQAFVGSMAAFVVEPDLEERRITVPPELTRLLKQDRELARWFEKLSDSMRRYMADRVSASKNKATRERRAQQIAENILLAMEGEQVLPPVLQVAFRRQPRAGEGWKAMTPIQRRNHLLAIFYYQSPDARNRRAQKAVQDAMRVAEKKS